jgi:hypothetical protein
VRRSAGTRGERKGEVGMTARAERGEVTGEHAARENEARFGERMCRLTADLETPRYVCGVRGV